MINQTFDLKKLFPGINQENAAKYNPVIVSAMQNFGIDTLNRQRAFLANIAHETALFSVMTENLIYSAQGLMKTWPSRFNAETAAKYARHPEMIANKVYANRLGNGNEASGDGWKYRGRGGIQITGKSYYAEASKALNENFVTNPDLVATPQYTMQVSALWWQKHGLNEIADKLGGKDDLQVFTSIRVKVNGGKIGLQDAINLYEHLKTNLV